VSCVVVLVKVVIFLSDSAFRLSFKDCSLLNSFRAADVAMSRCMSPKVPGGSRGSFNTALDVSLLASLARLLFKYPSNAAAPMASCSDSLIDYHSKYVQGMKCVSQSDEATFLACLNAFISSALNLTC